MPESSRQIKLIATNEFKTTDICALFSLFQFRRLGVCLRHNKIAIILKERSSILNDHRHLTYRAGENSVKLPTHFDCI